MAEKVRGNEGDREEGREERLEEDDERKKDEGKN